MGLVDRLKNEAVGAGVTLRTREAWDWFRRRSHSIRRVNRNALMKENNFALRNQNVVGRMYFYYYQPKHRETLPYYDSFPLSIIVGPAPGGFYGLNLHYIPPVLRAKLMDNLMDIATNRKYDENTKFKISYGVLKSTAKLRAYQPCFKHYLADHVRSRFALVPAEDWPTVMFLPAADWQKSSARNVYRESLKLLK